MERAVIETGLTLELKVDNNHSECKANPPKVVVLAPEKIIEKMDEDSDSEYTIKNYIEFRDRVLNKFKMKTWYETPKDKDIIFAVQDFDPAKMTVQLRVKDRGAQLLKDIAMDEENFTQFLHQPSLFKLDDMY
jgi:hypothetical protein